MAEVHDCPIILAGEGHVLDVLFSAVWCAERADDPRGLIELSLLYQCFDHFIAPVLVRLNDLFTDAGLAFKLLRVVVPPLLRGVT